MRYFFVIAILVNFLLIQDCVARCPPGYSPCQADWNNCCVIPSFVPPDVFITEPSSEGKSFKL
jgi:hypothetical protein